jgi:fermentation-respiration switch protein FrsA (DUF1100 family)
MDLFWTIVGIAAPIIVGLAFLTLITSYICFYMVFYVSKKERTRVHDDYEIPEGEAYEKYRDDIVNWTKSLRATPHEIVETTSFDGLKLRGKYYEYAPGAPIELMFHGYRGNSVRDLSGGVARCFALGRSALIVGHRGSGESEGCVITFGVNESRDCLSWLDYMTERFGEDQKIILTGISMGAATVMMATTYDLPKNVVGILADCGYTSAEAIIKKVMRGMKLPVPILYPFIKLGARIYGHFDLEENPPIEAMKKCTLPVFFAHGDADDFVPCSMSEENFNACASEFKYLEITPGAGHGLCFPCDQERYLKALKDFYDPILNDK